MIPKDAGALVADRTARLDCIDAAAYSMSTTDADGLWKRLTADGSTKLSSGYVHVWLDGRRELLLDQSVPQVGASRQGSRVTPEPV